MARVLSFLIRFFCNYHILHRSDLAARAAPLDARLFMVFLTFDHLKPLLSYMACSYIKKRVELNELKTDL